MHKSFGAIGLIVLLLLVMAILFSFGNLIPTAISERLVEATDVQYADATESKFLVFQQALETGSVPANTVKRLEGQGVKVENNTLIYKDEVITAENFINKVHADAGLYNAFTAATYDRAAYYYDESAEKVFKKIGTNRNNYDKDSNFEEVMTKLVGKGSSINISNVGLVEKTNDKGEKYTDYATVGEDANSKSKNAEEFVKAVNDSNSNSSSLLATMDTATALNTADTISKEQKSSIFFLSFMENISKMKAGYGNDSKINEAMNYLFREQESSVVDTKTGKEITVKGSMLESPSLYAVLSGEKINPSKVVNYASDRILKTIENRTGVAKIDATTRESSVASAGDKLKGTIGKYLSNGAAASDYNSIAPVVPIINSSLIENDFETIAGIYGGEMLVEGAVNVGKMLAKGSGATAGDGNATKSYARLNSTILALDREADKINRSPFDITSKNTFLGSIIYNLGVGVYKNFSPVASADDNSADYLTNFGDCETINSIDAVGTAGCSEIATFDTSTLDNTFHNNEFIQFVNENTMLENGKRTIKKDSVLADFIKYNNERIAPIGVMDGGILESIKNKSTSLNFISSIISLIKAFLGASDEDKAIATGKTFVNSTANPDWSKYKYAQRYVSLARATDALRQYDGDETAYNNLQFFEGGENPVIAFLNDYYRETIANW